MVFVRVCLQADPRRNTALSGAITTCLLIPDTTSSIEFDQPSPVLRHFLNAFLHSRVPPASSLPADTYQALILFATSLKATPVINLLKPLLPAYLKRKRPDPYNIFRSAIAVEDWHIAGEAMAKQSKNFYWMRDKSVKGPGDLALGCKVGTFDVDPAGLPYHFWMELPKKVTWAMVRACAEKKDWKERGEKFTQLMIYIESKLHRQSERRVFKLMMPDRDKIFPQYVDMEDDDDAADPTPDAGPGPGSDDSSSDTDEASAAIAPLASQIMSQDSVLISPPNLGRSARVRLRVQEPLFLPAEPVTPTRCRVLSDDSSQGADLFKRR
jgi:hypothetical protein